MRSKFPFRASRLLIAGTALLLLTIGAGIAPQSTAAEDSVGSAVRSPCIQDFFAEEVWPKVVERTCINCHTENGDAAESALVLADPVAVSDAAGRREALERNRSAFRAAATEVEDGGSRMLIKIVGGLDHGGGTVVEPDSTAYRILAEYAAGLRGRQRGELDMSAASASDGDAAPFFADVAMLDDRRLLRRITLSLVGRLPTPEESAAVEIGGLDAIGEVMDAMMQEPAFYERLKEGFNDIFLTNGYDGVAENVLSYDHFNTTRHWYQKFDLDHIPEDERTKARYKLTDTYREAIRNEPLELIAYIVRNDRPFTEIVTADYIMVSPFTARGYGIFETLKSEFDDPDDPFEYIPTRLEALRDRSGKVQESATGYYPHAGLLSTFHYLRRYPTTETNRNRLRARMYFQHFLGIDVMELAPRVTDAAAVDSQFENPTMQAADCVVCHRTIDPVAGLFQDYYNEDGYFKPRKDGWFTDMFESGFDGRSLPQSERWRALQWLGSQTADDPRFAAAMVEHVYYLLTGRNVLRPPSDIDDPFFSARRRAYLEQREMIAAAADHFVASDFNLKEVFKSLALSDFYRADSLLQDADSPQRQAELEDIGVVRLLAPEQLNRKLHAVFGRGWGPLEESFEILYGGIDSKTVTERNTVPGGAMGAIQRMMANEIACKTVPRDFTLPRSSRRLFPNIEPDIAPGLDEAAELQIRLAIVELHDLLLGLSHRFDDPDVDLTYELFESIVAEAGEQEGIDRRESYFCRADGEDRVDDPHYTIRGWRAVVTYLLRRQEFLYE